MGLSFFLSVRLLVAYGNQNQTTHVKAPSLATLARRRSPKGLLWKSMNLSVYHFTYQHVMFL